MPGDLTKGIHAHPGPASRWLGVGASRTEAAVAVSHVRYEKHRLGFRGKEGK